MKRATRKILRESSPLLVSMILKPKVQKKLTKQGYKVDWGAVAQLLEESSKF